MFEKLLMAFVEHGPFGLVAAFALYWAYRKDRENTALFREFMAAAKEFTKITEAGNSEIEKLADLIQQYINRRRS